MKKILLLALLLSIAAPSYATTYYTAKLCSGGSAPPNCTNANNGTSRATAELTIAAGIAHLAAGDTLIIGDGVYNESNLNLPAGTSPSHTIMQAENRNLAIIRPINPGNGNYAPVAQVANYATFDGMFFDCSNWENGSAYTGCAPFVAYGNHLTIKNGTAKGSRGGGTGPTEASGIDLAQSHGGNNIVSNNDIIDNGSLDVHADHQIYLGGPDNLVEYNRIRDSIAEGEMISIYDPTVSVSGDIIRFNTLYNNTHSNSVITIASTVTSIEISGNVIYGNMDKAIWVYGSGISNALIAFNTIYGNGGYAVTIDSGSSSTTVRNNIFWANGTDGISNSGTGTTSDHNLSTDPDFVNAAIGDFHLLSGSSALPPCGTAIGGITADKDGITRPNPPSCGAYEVPSGSDPEDQLAEDFESYTATSSICAANGGAGWTQSWTCDNGTATVETAGCSLTGKALRLNATTTTTLQRHFTGHTGSFSISFKMCLSITNPDSGGNGVEMLDQSGVTQASAYFNSSGNIVTATQTLSAYSANTACTVEFNFDTAVHPGEFRAKACGGSYSSWEPTVGSWSSIASFGIGSYSTIAHTFWLDDISETLSGGGTITVATPVSGQKCVSGASCLISWGSNALTGTLDGLYYLVNGNDTPHLIASPAVSATPYTWTVNAPAGTTIVIRAKQGSVTDDSDAFTVLGTKTYFK